MSLLSVQSIKTGESEILPYFIGKNSGKLASTFSTWTKTASCYGKFWHCCYMLPKLERAKIKQRHPSILHSPGLSRHHYWVI